MNELFEFWRHLFAKSVRYIYIKSKVQVLFFYFSIVVVCQQRLCRYAIQRDIKLYQTPGRGFRESDSLNFIRFLKLRLRVGLFVCVSPIMNVRFLLR